MKSNSKLRLALTALAAVGIIFTFSNSTASANTGLSWSDQSFMTKAAQGGMAEVQDAQVIADRTHSGKVSSFAHRMIHDHSIANDKLMALASDKGFQLPSSPTYWQQHVMNNFKSLKGHDLNRAYINQEVKDHESTVSLFENAAHHANDPDVRHFAMKTLPTLREHLKMAQQLQAEIGS